jgi:hypothetical protein
MSDFLDKATDEMIHKKYLLWHYGMIVGFGGELLDVQKEKKEELLSDDIDIEGLNGDLGGFSKFQTYALERLRKAGKI